MTIGAGVLSFPYLMVEKIFGALRVPKTITVGAQVVAVFAREDHLLLAMYSFLERILIHWSLLPSDYSRLFVDTILGSSYMCCGVVEGRTFVVDALGSRA